MYCDTQTGHVCVSLMITQQPGWFWGGSGSPTPTRRQLHYSDLGSVAGRANWNAAGRQTVSSVKNTCINREWDRIKCVVDVRTGAGTALRRGAINMWTEAYVEEPCLLTSLSLIQRGVAVSFCPPSACQRSQGLKEHLGLMEKQTSLLSLIVPRCYVIIKHLLIVPLATCLHYHYLWSRHI